MIEKLRRHLTELTEIRPYRNWLNHASLETAASYIESAFKGYGLSVSRQQWNVGNFEYENIIAAYRPELEKRLIIGAHYDVYDKQPGADDNTSGVAGLLFLAEEIAKENPDLPYGIDFIGYCLEEPPHFGTKNMGSYVHAKSLKDNNVPTVGMICLDMIGYYSDEPNSQTYPLSGLEKQYPTIGNYIGVVGINEHKAFSKQVYSIMKAANEIDVQLFNFPSNNGLAGLSDHRNYWHFGYDAVMINDTAKYRNPNYHKITDTVASLDLEKMAATIRSLKHVLLTPLIEKEERPETEPPKEEPYQPQPDRISFIQRFFEWLKKLFSRS